MSMMRCENCGFPVNTDDDPESLYVEGWGCVCEMCREDMDVFFDDEEVWKNP